MRKKRETKRTTSKITRNKRSKRRGKEIKNKEGKGSRKIRKRGTGAHISFFPPLDSSDWLISVSVISERSRGR